MTDPFIPVSGGIVDDGCCDVDTVGEELLSLLPFSGGDGGGCCCC